MYEVHVIDKFGCDNIIPADSYSSALAIRADHIHSNEYACSVWISPVGTNEYWAEWYRYEW